MLAPSLVGQKRRLVGLGLCAIGGGFAEAGVLVLIARAALALTSEQSRVHVAIGPVDTRISTGWIIGIAASLVGARFLLNVLQARLTARTTTTVLVSTRRRLVRAFLGAPWSLQAAEREGRLQELLTTYAQQISAAVLSLSQGAVAAFNIAAFVATALVVNTVTALLLALTASGLGLLLRPLRGVMRRRSRRTAEANVAFATAATELAATTQEIRIFDVEDAVMGRLDALAERHSHLMFRTRFLGQLTPAVFQAVALLLVVGALGFVNATEFTGLTSLGAQILLLLRTLTYGQVLQSSLQTLHESAPYSVAVCDDERRYLAAAAPRTGDPVARIGELSFQDVQFAYEPGRLVLRNVSFRVPPGEIVGIIGPSGAGKSTLVQLMLRLREPSNGRILANDRDIRELSLDDWYRHVTFVPQEPKFFAGTIADNIRFFRDVDDAAVERAAKRAHLHQDIVAKPLGYDTPAGERGRELSGGQRQRLCIARALVDEPDLIVLDEPTSALDPKSEALMRETMSELAPRMTVFVIAHRISTLSICNRIMVVRNGTVEAFDEPEQLEADDAFYQEVLQLSGLRPAEDRQS